MSVTVKIPAQLRAATGGEGELEVEGSTVGEALDAVFDQHDGLRERITQDGDLRRFVNVYVSGEDIRFQDGLDTARSEEHTSELQSRLHLVCRLLLEKKKHIRHTPMLHKTRKPFVTSKKLCQNW